jgi:hypothetical protein
MTRRQFGISAEQVKDLAQAGWNQSFDKLSERLARAQTSLTLTVMSDRA